MKDAKYVKAVHPVEVRDGDERLSWTTLDVQYQRLAVIPPVGQSSLPSSGRRKHPSLKLAVSHARERSAPFGKPPSGSRT